MKHQLKLMAAAGLIAASAITSQALPYNARGSFNGWGETALTDNLDGTHSVAVTGLTPSTGYDFKIAENDWASSWPGGNAKTSSDASGNITFRFRPAITFDGWNPQAARVGFDDPGLFGWEIIGAINDIGGGWDEPSNAAARQMVNQGNGLYTVNYTIAKPPGTYDFKFRKSADWAYQYTSDQWNPGGGNLQVTTTSSNQSVLFQLDLKNGRYLAGAPLAAATNNVTFTVDMGVPISEYPAASGFDTNFDTVYVRGNFNSWATETAFALTNRIPGTTIYSNTVKIVAYPGNIQYKFFGDAFPGEEKPLLSCNGTRVLNINSTTVTAPLAYWSDRSLSDPTNLLTFQLDMALQTALGNFNPGTDLLYLRGSFNDFAQTLQLTNLAAPDTNIYIATLAVTNWPIGSCIKYKYFTTHTGAPNAGWESPLSTGGQDRQFNIASAPQTLPAVFFDDIEICDVVEQTNFVTFTVNMTNAVGTFTDSTVYDGTQNVYINGSFAGWWGWGVTNGAATNYLMTQVPGTSNYTYTAAIPPGFSLRMQYKYSMNGTDDEAGSGQDHVRYIRTVPGQTSYAMPLDTWTGVNPVNIANLQEPKFGNLRAVPGSPGEIQVQWLGIKCVQLQSAGSLGGGSWVTYTNTSGFSGTNLPSSGGQGYFRLVDPSP